MINFSLRFWFISILYYVLAHGATYGADISGQQVLYGQSGATVDAFLLDRHHQQVTFSADNISDLNIIPGQPYKGNTTNVAYTHVYGWTDQLTLGISLAAIKEKLSQEYLDFAADPKTHLQGEIFLKYRLWRSQNLTITAIPFIESGFAKANRFSYGSKTRVGTLLSSNYRFGVLDLGVNLHLRYRPAAIHGIYRVASDSGFSVQPRLRVADLQLWTEISQRSIAILNINHSNSNYTTSNTQNLAVGLHKQFAFGNIEFGFARSIQPNSLGSTPLRVNLAYSMVIQGSDPKPSPLHQSPYDDSLSPGRKIYWLDQLRRQMVKRNTKSLNNFENFSISGETVPSVDNEVSVEEETAKADQEIKRLREVEQKMKKYSRPKADSQPTPSKVTAPALIPVNVDI